MKAANYSPVYCALYPKLAEISRSHGYALAVHGSMARDFDLVCIPWVDQPSKPGDVVREIEATFYTRCVGGPPDTRAHGREVWTLSVGHGECFLDLSFMPSTPPTAKPLTVDRILDIVRGIDDQPDLDTVQVLVALTRAIEAAHGIKEQL